MADNQRKLQALSDELTKLQEGKVLVPLSSFKIGLIHQDLQSTIAARQKLESQQQENKSVQKVRRRSLATVPNVYKIIYP